MKKEISSALYFSLKTKQHHVVLICVGIRGHYTSCFIPYDEAFWVCFQFLSVHVHVRPQNHKTVSQQAQAQQASKRPWDMSIGPIWTSCKKRLCGKEAHVLQTCVWCEIFGSNDLATVLPKTQGHLLVHQTPGAQSRLIEPDNVTLFSFVSLARSVSRHAGVLHTGFVVRGVLHLVGHLHDVLVAVRAVDVVLEVASHWRVLPVHWRVVCPVGKKSKIIFCSEEEIRTKIKELNMWYPTSLPLRVAGIWDSLMRGRRPMLKCVRADAPKRFESCPPHALFSAPKELIHCRAVVVCEQRSFLSLVHDDERNLFWR